MPLYSRRRRCLALATLAAFLIAQPAVGCAALCAFERHLAGTHTMSGMERGSVALTNSVCHASATGTVQQPPLQVLSPMVPASAPFLADAPERWTEPIWSMPAAPHLVSHSIEPPPPRLV
jgi:hypothetical protein